MTGDFVRCSRVLMLVACFSATSLPLVVAAPAAAKELASEQGVTGLVRDLSMMKSFNATFHQWVSDAQNHVLQEVTGTMWVQRPGLFRWDTNDPYPQQIISDGEVLWIYDLDLEQATKRKLDKQVGNTPALLLSGDPEKLAESFTVRASMYEETGEVRYDLIPKHKGALFELLRVHFRSGKIHDMFLRDNLGQTTRIEFETKAFNKPIDAKVFAFKPPKGVDVIEDM
ncbi:Outer-membrane lipoprotein carrier protein [gamma proteobacterium HdN1]|nr:Outer-membrane lipoprotein carrier protein [gamma proteobacterium HdN1]